jgi:TolB protein
VKAGDTRVRNLTRNGTRVHDSSPAWSPDGSRIAFVRRYDGRREAVFVMNADGGGKRRVTSYPGGRGLVALSWSPDGERIAFVRNESIWVVNAEGTAPRRLIRNAGLPAWSPDGSKILFVGQRGGQGSSTEIWVANANGTGQRRLTHGDGAWNPAWSPDGRRIAFSQCTELVEGDCPHARIVVVGADGRGLRVVSRPSATEWTVDEKPAWSPDGRSIAFTRTPSFAMNSIWVVRANGTGQRKVLDDRSAAEHSPSWSPDGRRLAYATDYSGPDAIFTVRPDGKLRKRVVVQKPLSPEDAGGTAQSPAYAPSGALLAVTFDGDIWTMNQSGGNRRRVTRDGGDNADWARAR